MTNEESEHINDLWEDMDRLNALYEELMWDNDDVLEFVADTKTIELLLRIGLEKMRMNDRTKLIYALNHLAHLHDHIEGNYWEDYLRENIESMEYVLEAQLKKYDAD